MYCAMSMSPRKNKHFSMEETCTLLDVWADNNIQAKFLKSYKHDVIWEQISVIMISLGFNRTKQECCNRVNNLKRQFAKIRKTVDAEEQLDNNPYWLRFLTVENNKSLLEDEQNHLDGENCVKLNNENEFYTMELVDSRAETEQGMTSAAPISSEEYKPSSVSSSPNASFDNDIYNTRKSINKRRYVEDDYIKQLLENDRLMLQNQWKRLKQDEEISKSATNFFNAMTTYVNNCMNNFEGNPDCPVLNTFPMFSSANAMKYARKNSKVEHTDRCTLSSDNMDNAVNHNEIFQIDQSSSHVNGLPSEQSNNMSLKFINSNIEDEV